VDGAAACGFETEYWGEPYLAVLPWLNAHAQNSFCAPVAGNLLDLYHATGRLTREFRVAEGSPADYLVLLIRQGMISQDPQLWDFYTHQKPAYSVKVRHTLLLGIYDMKSR
jgi:hypothetical protein